jgi:hypothetical protein
MSDLEEQFVRETFASNWIAPLGPQVDAFEADRSRRILRLTQDKVHRGRGHTAKPLKCA